MPRQKSESRVLGPYAGPRGFRVCRIDESGEARWRTFKTEQKARIYKEGLENQLQKSERSLDDAFDAYEHYMEIEKGNKAGTIAENLRRLRSFFPDSTLPLSAFDSERCKSLYLTYSEGKAVDSHRNVLAGVKTFFRFCVGRGWLRENPAEAIKGFGKRRHRKEQLRITEAKRWLEKAMELANAEKRDEAQGPIAAMLTLVLDLRVSEVVTRTVRDVDDDGQLLWIPDSKTEAGRRTLKTDIMRPYLLALGAGREPTDYLFEARYEPGQRYRNRHPNRKWVLNWVKRICELAGVPRVSAHGMRGTHATLAWEHGETSTAVARALGHTNVATTFRSYIQPDAVVGRRQRTALRALVGGKK